MLVGADIPLRPPLPDGRAPLVMSRAHPDFVTGGLLIAPDSPAVDASYAAGNGEPHPVFALFESMNPRVGCRSPDDC